MPKPGAKELTDLTELRALAHPLRMQLFLEVGTRGEATVSELAAAVDEPVNKVSFHLRQLAKYGFIEDAPERARDKRDRWWRLAYESGINWDRLLASQTTAPAVRKQLTQGMEDSLEAIRAYFSEAIDRLPDWQRGDFSHDWYLRMTSDEAAEFDADYLELCQRWRERVQQRIEAGDTDGRQNVAILIFGFPLP